MTFVDSTSQLKAEYKGQTKWDLGERVLDTSCLCMIQFPSQADLFPKLLRFNDLRMHRGLLWNTNVISPLSEYSYLFKLQQLHMNLL